MTPRLSPRQGCGILKLQDSLFLGFFLLILRSSEIAVVLPASCSKALEICDYTVQTIQLSNCTV